MGRAIWTSFLSTFLAKSSTLATEESSHWSNVFNHPVVFFVNFLQLFFFDQKVTQQGPRRWFLKDVCWIFTPILRAKWSNCTILCFFSGWWVNQKLEEADCVYNSKVVFQLNSYNSNVYFNSQKDNYVVFKTFLIVVQKEKIVNQQDSKSLSVCPRTAFSAEAIWSGLRRKRINVYHLL